MIVVIQCAGSKHADAGLLRAKNGTPVLFVAQPQLAPSSSHQMFAHPDDCSDDGTTWRDILTSYNASCSNPLNLSRAFELYSPPAAPSIYRRLVDSFGFASVYILSAGWGLIRSDFLTPAYDITFAPEVRKKASWKYRHPSLTFRDFRQLPDDVEDEIVFIGSKSYQRLFCHLTQTVRAKKTAYYNSSIAPSARGCEFMRFASDNKRTWYYECAAEQLRRSHEGK